MSWKKACLIFYIAVVVTAMANIEKVSVWVDERLADGPAPGVAREVRHVRNLWRETGLAAVSRKMDCDLAPYFDETYKNTLACRDAPATAKAAQALHDRLDPNQPVLKGDIAVDTTGLLAALAPPHPLGTGDEEATAPVAGAPATEHQEGPKLTAAKLQAPHRMLVVGDSLAIGLSLSLRRSVAELDGVQLFEEGKVSSGLANPKYYDWGRALRVFLDKYDPDVVVVMMGANDAKYINVNEKPRPPGSTNKTWPEVFAMRLENLLGALQDKGIRNYWIGLPIMGDPAFAKQAQVMNEILKTECAKYSTSRFLETWNLLTDAQGNYSTFLPNEKGVKIKVRANDKIHFTVAGGDILAQSFLASLAKDMELRPKKSDATNTTASNKP
ncbi:conserved hypothetical protein [Solidesulfovibrio fructosivorans JJ]]|uniref:Uncharacterized protein n=1 Tax=Solidesulfovibrio fructosivorans JJ] TaxID=596151 RepID=E1JW66_SOLFR|nr:DUF459 domain-containing protein [Solidesulfovibrio fructosivorans]EFL51426.1 conserved hypothetical protein [Solidesulfovibrio fructosivorans JJ]]